MAILRKKQEIWLTKEPASRIYYDVRYQGPGYNQTAFFAAIPQDQGAAKMIDGIEYIEGAKGKNNGAYGFRATTEKEAIEKFTKCMRDDYNQGVKKEKCIFLDNDNQTTRSSFGDGERRRQVTFSYKMGVKVVRKNETKYFEINAAGFETSYEINDHSKSIVPWTEEREEACKAIMRLFDQLQDRVNLMVKNDAIGLLDKNLGLLLAPGQ